METDPRLLRLFGRLVDLHRRKTEAQLLGYDTKTYETLIDLYMQELAEIEEAAKSATPSMRLKTKKEQPLINTPTAPLRSRATVAWPHEGRRGN
jgi:hypothetical protein